MKRLPLLIVAVLLSLQPFVVSAAAPRQVTKVKVQDITQESAKVRWQQQQGIQQYIVQLLDSSGNVLQSLKSKRRVKTVSNLTAGTDYGVKVRAVKGKKKGPWSSVVEFSTLPLADDDEQQELYEKYSAVNGTFTGGWNNLTFETTGDTTVEVDVQPDGTASFTLDLGGMVFGAFDPDPLTYTSAYNTNGIVFTATDDPVFGTVTITVIVNDDGTADVTLDSQYVPTGGIETVTATGTLTQDALDMEYTIGLILGATANGTFTLDRQ